MKKNKKIYDLILRSKEELLSLDNPVEFIFSHSALGVGWDNPNVFNIATLNQSYSEIKKRQEIGRGLRISVNQEGQRVYDNLDIPEGQEINLLTIIPNETYETFVSQYQSEIEDIYGTNKAGAETRNIHKGENRTEKQISRNDKHFKSSSFAKFWKSLSKKTQYLVSFNEEKIINESIKELNNIKILEHKIQVSLGRLKDISEKGIKTEDFRTESKKAKIVFNSIDLIEEISESTSLAYPTVFKIIKDINKNEIIKNPPRFLQEAIDKIKKIELDEMLRALNYQTTGESFNLDGFEKFILKNTSNLEPTTNKGIYDHIIWDSEIEQQFAREADKDTEVVCFLKLPSFYVINTPAGLYNPDLGLVLKKKKIRSEDEQEYYFVIETKGTDMIEDSKALKGNEIYKIKCAIKHFKALGIEANYIAPVKDFETFKNITEEKC